MSDFSLTILTASLYYNFQHISTTTTTTTTTDIYNDKIKDYNPHHPSVSQIQNDTWHFRVRHAAGVD